MTLSQCEFELDTLGLVHSSPTLVNFGLCSSSPVQLRSFCSICNTPVLVPCPNITAAEMVFKLFKDQEYLSNISCIHSNSTLTCELSKTSADIQVQKHQQEKSVSFLLTGVTDSSQGIYGCEGTKKFPPPMITVQSDVRIQVLQGKCLS